MTLYFWIKENGIGGYCEGFIPDGSYDESSCILVSKRPSLAHKWNNSSEQWEIDIEKQRSYIKPLASFELSRTDKFTISDRNEEFSALEKQQLKDYRRTLLDLPKKTTIEEMVMPTCPEFLKD